MRSPSPASPDTHAVLAPPPSAVTTAGWAVALGVVALACAWVPFLLEARGVPWRAWGVGAASLFGAAAIWLASRRDDAALPSEHFLGDVRQAELQKREERWSARTALSADWYWQTDAQLRGSGLCSDRAS